jgi:hypothetical protein
MTNNFFLKNSKALFQLNLISIVITFFCEVFVIYTFVTKAFVEGLERWKYMALLIGLVIVSLLFIGSVAIFVYFLLMKKKK